jgi:hypothetical protein
MRLLVTTAVTLAMLIMAAITYLAVGQDPLGGEPRAVIAITPPDMAKLHAAADPAPTVAVPSLAASSSDPKPAIAISEPAAAPAQQAPPVAKAADQNTASAATPLTSTNLQNQQPAARDPSIEGLSVAIPQ